MRTNLFGFGSRSYSAKDKQWTSSSHATKGVPGFSQKETIVSGSGKSYKVWKDGDVWRTSLDPESEFSSKWDVVKFVKHWRGNPGTSNKDANYFSIVGGYQGAYKNSKGKWIGVNNWKYFPYMKPSPIIRWQGPPNREIVEAMKHPTYIDHGLSADELRSRVMKKNPSNVEELAEGFHGRSPLEDIHITEEETYNKDQAVIGILEELEIVSDDGMFCTPINFRHHYHRSAFAKGGKEKDAVYVTFPNRHQIEFIGGDQKLPSEGDKALITIGPVFSISYWTDKMHLSDGTGFSTYVHHFGEESIKMNNDKPTQKGMIERIPFMPLLCYNSVNQKLLLVGGVYTVRDEGITN